MLGWLRRWRKKGSDEPTTPAEESRGEEYLELGGSDKGPGSASAAPPGRPRASAPRAPGEPRIVPRPEHNISRRDISVNALKVMSRLIQHGYKGYLVGGAPRDILIGRRPKDFDVATDAHPEQVRALFRNSRMIGRRFRIVHVFFHGGEIVEVSTFRRGIPFDFESENPNPNENTFGTPAEDAQRRDLTINSLFYDLQNFAIYDFVGGLDDIEHKLIRVIGEPCSRFREDPIRMLRAVRHAVGTGFEIEPVTLAGIRQCADEITRANPSRLRDEFLRELTGGRSRASLEKMLDLGILAHILPASRDVLGENGPPAARAHFLANLAGMDEAVQRGRPLPPEVVFGAFCAPFVDVQSFEAPGDPRQARGQRALAVRDYLKPLLASLGVSKAHAEGASLAIVGARQLMQAAARGPNLPKGLTRKSTFPSSLLLCQIEARGRRQWLPKPLFDSAREHNLLLFAAGGAPPNRRPRRRRSGQKPDAAPAPAAPATPAPAAKPADAAPDSSLRFDPTSMPKADS